ncbi:MAG: sulfatase-like hydrolase/transferase [Myxococcales bacterium]|nr:sulfatase-like hydrolase/transferase [Myxococcales bacterium]
MPDPGKLQPPVSRPPLIAEQLLLVPLWAIAVGLMEGIWTLHSAPGQMPPGLEPLEAIVHLIGLQLPLALPLALALALGLGLLRASRALDPILTRLREPGRWLEADPETFGWGLAAPLTLAAHGLGAWILFERIRPIVANPANLGWVLGICSVGLLALTLLVGRLLLDAMRALARWMGPQAHLATLLALYLLALGAGAFALLETRGAFLRAIDWRPIGSLLVGLGAYLLLLYPLRRALEARPPSISTWSWLLSCALLVCLVWPTVTALTYGGSNRIRNLVEGETALGGTLSRAYATLFDRDGDGYASLFGGGDCDDADPEVNPGALDPPGDGVDSDCLGGDGGRDVGINQIPVFARRVTNLPRPNIVIFSIDALRPDHLGALGYERATSPNMDALIERAAVFENAIAQSSRTLYSIPPMFTGMAPSQIAYGDEYYFRSIGAEVDTLPERLGRLGYATSAVIGTDYFDRLPSLFQGFDSIRESGRDQPPRAEPVDRGIEELERLSALERPFLLWIHQYNVHAPYLPDRIESRFGPLPMDRYDTEIWHADAHFGRLMAALERLELEEKTIVVLASDHGEAFGEHGHNYHARTLYEEEIRSLLAIHVPGLEPRRIQGPVALMDLTPTLLNLVGQPMREALPSRSLVPVLRGDELPDPERRILSEYMPDGIYDVDTKAIRTPEAKLIWWVSEGRVELFDLLEDPQERTNIADDRPEQAEQMLDELKTWLVLSSRPELLRSAIVDRLRHREIPEMSERLDLDYGGHFTLLGYSIPSTTYEPGDEIDLRLFFRAEAPMTQSYFFEMRFFEGERDRSRRLHANHWPLHANYPTDRWRPGEILEDPVKIVLPTDLQAPLELSLRLRVLENRQRSHVLRPHRRSRVDGAIELLRIDVR